MNMEEVFEKVSEVIVDASDVEADEISLDKRLIDDLDIDSIDMMELIYSIEKIYGVELEIGDFEGAMNREMNGVPFAKDNIITDEGLQKLRELMPEVDQAKIQPGLAVYNVPFLFTVESLCKLIMRKSAAKN